MLAHRYPERTESPRLRDIINLNHALCRLAEQINWSVFEEELGPFYSETQGAPAKPIRLLVGLHYLKYTYDYSDEGAVYHLVENPYWQYFCGFEYFVHELPLHPTSMVKWRQRVGADKLEVLLQQTLDLAKGVGLIEQADLDRVNVDTTVQEKAIAFPTDARLYHKMRERLVKLARACGVKLRQSYVRVGKAAFVKQNRYRHARQHKRANGQLRKLKTYLGRVVRDIERKVEHADEPLESLLSLARRLLAQEKTSRNKLYAIHAPEVECIAKGKAHKRYEFGCKVSIVSSSKSNWVLGIQAHHGNPYDGHTLADSLAQSERLTGHKPKEAFVDLGFRGHDYEGETIIHIVGRVRKRLSRTLRHWYRRRSAIEPVIGHLKQDDRLGRNYLKGKEGDKINALLSGCGFNMRKLLKAFFLWLFRELNWGQIPADHRAHRDRFVLSH